MPLSDEDLARELFRAGLVTMDDIKQAADRRTPHKNLGMVLVESGIVNEAAIQRIDPGFSMQLVEAPSQPPQPSRPSAPSRPSTPTSPPVSMVDLTQVPIDRDAVSLIHRDRAVAFKAIPIGRDGNKLIVAMANPRDLPAIDELTRLTGCRIEPVPVNPQQISQFINTLYVSASAAEIGDIAPPSAQGSLAGQEAHTDELVELVDQAPTVRIVNMILNEAVKLGASDIHVEPRGDALYLRFRVDGLLRPPVPLDKMMEQAIISRFKVLSNMNLAESRLPQDGRFRQTIGGNAIDFRVSTLPTYHGEKVVLRLLDKSSLVSMDKLGLQPEIRKEFEELVLRPQGMILVTGPTGSGKSTTLYAALSFCRSETKNVVTVEDPIEYQMEGINQTQVLPKINLTFARQLRAILRQDPDVILVGEIRDRETADMAFRAALTGHLVLSTLHTNDAPSTVTRLLDMGMEPYMIASCILAVLAQRLLRLICPHCKDRAAPDEFELARVGMSKEEAKQIRFYRGRGCQACGFTGYKGRVGIYELMVMSEPIRQKVAMSATASEVRLAALAQGMQTLKQDGLSKVKQGLTTLEELSRVLFATIEDELAEAEHPAEELDLETEESETPR